ncbi:hypothetical protein BCR34DRAFT_568014 [Clohesyomyces aquaticus]|uniref:Berberine/berberine-like domain-containing protein n=1 Tax=Clohesyomyces aquaticus TaxID=1231657 RepID=A0A1Y1ZHE2_9PLEO|nr:hypothetical protein BCR34DRAFT_568014 [Clohesyomyces aquaticus]
MEVEGGYSYVNYACVGESMQELYGHEAWRREKLGKLKREYDPENCFGIYAPIGYGKKEQD